MAEQTEPLYLKDSYIKEFGATVVEVNGKHVVLDRTALYPTGGGQPSDTGRLIGPNDAEYFVSDVSKKDGRIVHTVDKDGLKAGDAVNGFIDWDRRYLLMRYHTATHILCAVIHKHTGAEITGNQIGEQQTRIDFNLENFDRDKFAEYETEANQLIALNKQVKIRFLPREEALKLPGLSKLKMGLPPSIQTVRVLTIEDIDEQADGGCHVNSTGEIGTIKIVDFENKGKNNRRVYFKLVE